MLLSSFAIANSQVKEPPVATLADCMADSKRPTLEVEERPERGTRATKRLRSDGYVPGVVYGGDDCVSFKVNNRVLRAALHDGSALIDLKIGSGKARPVIIKDQQHHPVRGQVLHIDLLEVRLDQTIHSTVMVELEGVEDAPGVKEGGVLEHVSRELGIEALPTDIPDRILVDVSEMGINAVMHLSEVTAPQGVTFLDDPEETIIATITVPTEVEEPEIEEETELVGEDGQPIEAAEAEAEAGAEGATGDEAAQQGEAAAEGGGEES
jgi:large subunit ribosomal protein L25